MMNQTLLYPSRQFYCLWLMLALLFALGSQGIGAQTLSGNPILPGSQADPAVRSFNGKYYIYPTSDAQHRFHAYSSSDLTNWVDEGVLFDLGPQCNWANVNGWAPDMIFRNGKYYFYYSAESQIGVAVCDSPTGGCVDRGSPIIPGSLGGIEAIDPMPFIDEDGEAYLYFGGSARPNMGIVKLNPDMTSYAGFVIYQTPQNFTEGAFVVKRYGTYYLMYSNGAWYNETYNVQYSTSASPTGPWTYRGQVLASQQAYTGPGHHSVVQKPGCDEYYIVYHRYENGNYNGRVTAIDRMDFNGDGTIAPVVMTRTGVPARPVNAPCQTGNPALVVGSIYELEPKNAPGKRLNQSGLVPNADIYTSNNAATQAWKLFDGGGGYFELEPQVEPGKRLDVSGAGSAERTNVAVWYQNGNDAQKWKLIDVGGGYYELEPKCAPGKRLDVAGGVTNDNANVWLWFQNDNDAQKWKFTPRSGARLAAEKRTLAGDPLSAYPNPAGGKVTVTYRPSQDGPMHLHLYNSKGILVQRVFEGAGKAGQEQQHTVNSNAWEPGMYLLKLRTPAGVQHEKLVITK